MKSDTLVALGRSVRGSSGGQSTAQRQKRRPRRSPTPFRYECGMRYRRLGSSDLEVSEIALGSWLTDGLGVDDSAARACVDKAIQVGIHFIDTPNDYGRGPPAAYSGDRP